MRFTDHFKVAIYAAVVLSVWSLIPLLPPLWFPGVAPAYWASHAVAVWPLLLLGAFGAGWVGTFLLNRKRTRAGERISPPSGVLVGVLTGVIGTVLGAALITAILIPVQHLLPGLPEDFRLTPRIGLSFFLMGHGISYILPAAAGGLFGSVWFRKRKASQGDAA